MFDQSKIFWISSRFALMNAMVPSISRKTFSAAARASVPWSRPEPTRA